MPDWRRILPGWATNCVHFQLVMLAYNLNCWLMLFHREEGVKADELKHTTFGHGTFAFSVRGGQDLAARRAWDQL